MNFTLYLNDEQPAVAAALMRERALLQAQGKVYVRPYVRSWPGGLAAALRSLKAKKQARRGRVLHWMGRRRKARLRGQERRVAGAKI